MEDFVYEVSSTEKVKKLEKELEQELSDLKNEIEENEMVHGITRSASSLPLPKDAAYFRRERQELLTRSMQVNEARPLMIQADRMHEELDNCLKSDYGLDGLPLLLHQFFSDRIRSLIQCKHLHMLRWKRFSEHTSTIEALYPLYNDRLAQILSEYNDCIQRAGRLATCRENFLANKTGNSLQALKIDDLIIYLRWLITHTHSLQRFNQFMRVIQWLPILHKQDFIIESKTTSEDEPSSSRIPARFQDDELRPRQQQQQQQPASRPSSALSSTSLSVAYAAVPHPPPINPTVLTTNPLPSSAITLAAAAGGGGIASDEKTLKIPLHVNDFDALKSQITHLVHLYGIETDVEKISTSADEMEMYAAVNRKFRQVFARQEHMKTFKTYDKLEIGQENWGADHSMHALKKEANWLPYVKLKAEKDPVQEKMMVELRSRNNVDELLRVMSKFIHVTDAERVQESLRDHAAVIRDPITPNPVSVTSHRTNQHTGKMWKRIYTNPELYADNSVREDPLLPPTLTQIMRKQDKLDVALEEIDEKDADNVNLSKGRSATAKKRRESYDYFDTVQLLGLDEGEQNSNDPASIQGAYLSFLQLRHLRIRDQQRTCLSVLNYFRSLERTLTINDEGLSLESQHPKVAQGHRKHVVDGSPGGGGGLGSHHYMHYTPKDYKLHEASFMEFSEIENHDDFYCMEEGRVHVQDQRGYYIVYDSAEQDLKNMEKDMLLVATHYIEKDKELRTQCRIARNESGRKRSQSSAGDFDISTYSHQEVDRFAVLMDLWTSEAAYMECKRELVDCYIEAYQHVYDRDERRALAQQVINLIYQRPQFDFDTDYFLRGYRIQCVTLRLHTQFVKSLLDKQIQEMRDYTEKVVGEDDKEFGLPHRIIPKQPISINMSRSALRNVYMLEFHPSLAIASRVPQALKHAYSEILHQHKPESVMEQLILHKRLLEVVNKEWDSVKGQPVGNTFAQTTQRDLFSGVYADDPKLMIEVLQTLLHQTELNSVRKSQKERHAAMLTTCADVLEVVTSRHRLIDTACESEVLSKIYRRQAVDMGYDECHLYLRFVQFEFANYKEKLRTPPIFITAIQEDDSSVDRYTPTSLYLAIHELDEGHVGRFSFRNRDNILTLLRGKGAANIQTALAAQVVHKNSLISAIQQAHACVPLKHMDELRGGRPSSPMDTKSEKSSATAMTGMSSGTGATTLGSRLGANRHNVKAPEAFVSLQLEKVPCRDQMLNEFIKRKEQMGSVLRNPEKMEEVKRSMIQDYCHRFHLRITQYSLRSQILAYYNSILKLLKGFPEIFDKYFMLGEPNEKKSEEDSEKGLQEDARSMKKRPRRVLSEDGLSVLNIWFIPHYTEVLTMFKNKDDEACHKALTFQLTVAAALHDILQYLCAHARLGSAAARLGSKKAQEMVSADWGGTEGIGADLREIQRQIDHLQLKTDPKQVCEFLSVRRDVMFLEFDAAVRHSMLETFLATSNTRAFNAVRDCMHFALHELSNSQRHGIESVYFNVPEPLEARDAMAAIMFPWRAFINREGPYPVSFWCWDQISYYMQLCLAGLRETERHVAHGEILGVSLLMEDVLLSGQQDAALYKADSEDEEDEKTGEQTVDTPTDTQQLALKDKAKPTKLSRTQQAIESYKLLKAFLLLWKRLEVFKYNWGKHKLIVEDISSPKLYKEFCLEYKKDMLYPVLQSVAYRYGQSDLYEGMVSDSEALVIPKGASEIEIKTKLLVKLAEHWESHMINEVRKKLAKELSLVLSERAREESALPTDLWKKSSMKESFTINKPHIAEDFTAKLMAEAVYEDQKEEGKQSPNVTFSKEHLNHCLNTLAGDVMAREKQNYESYSMYYENLLRVHHQLLYQREQESKQLRDQLQTAKKNAVVEVQCQLADTSQELLLEITALRAKIAEMREMSLTQEQDTRARIREEYDDLVHNLFNAAVDLKKQLDEYREDLHDNIHEQIHKSRFEASDAMTQLRQRSGATMVTETAQRDLQHAIKVQDIKQDNHKLNLLVTKMAAMNRWKTNHGNQIMGNRINVLQQRSDTSKKQYLELKMLAEEEVILLRQQLVALRSALKLSEKECENLRKDLDKELKAKKEKLHASQQRAQSQKQLEEARRSNIEKLLEEIDDKETRLRTVTEYEEKNQKMQHLMADKMKKDVSSIKKQLQHERSLKLDAFQRVDELQTTIYDIETGLFTEPSPVHRPQTAIGMIRAKSAKSRATSAKSRQRAKTAGVERSVPSSGGVWPPPVSWPANRSPTPVSEVYSPTGDPATKKLARPKTTVGRLRSRLAEQLLDDIEPPDHHETILKLQQLQLMKQEQNVY